MTVPLVILGAMAIFAGFLGAAPIHVEPLIHFLDTGFADVGGKIVTKYAHGSKEMWLMMLPGAAACALGIFGAYAVYYQRGGEPERTFAERFPRFYALVYDKWRIDELYDATVIGMVDALADIFTMADKWIVDGIIARLTALLTQGLGAVLRLFHTGRVQVYAASMVVGMVGMGWFFARPHARIEVDEAELKTTGKAMLKAPAGPGYSYKWSGEGVNDEGKFSASLKEFPIIVDAGKSRVLTLSVKNAFGQVSETSVTVTRPDAPKAPQARVPGAPGMPAQPPGQPGGAAPTPSVIRLKGEDVPGFIRQGGQ
jgi:NADH-quinone oxidoreductase subunit L